MRRNRFTISVHGLAIFSIELYLILSIVFETVQSDLSGFASIGLYLCIGCCILELALSNKWRLDWYGIALLILTVLLSVSSLWSPTSDAIKHTYLYRAITTYIVMILIGNVIDGYDDINKLINTIIVSGVLLAFQIYSRFGLENLISSGLRMGKELGNQNLLGWYCACSIFLSVYMLFVVKSKIRYIYIIPVISCIPAVMFSGSRRAIIVILISVINLMLVYNEKKKIVKRIGIGSLFILFILLAIENIPAFSAINERFAELTKYLTGGESQLKGDYNRIFFIQEGLRGFLKSPIIGNGFCYSYALLGAYTHNNYVELLLNHGIIGLLVFYFPHIKILFDNKKIRSTEKKWYALVTMIIISILVSDLGVVSYYNRFVLFLVLISVKIHATSSQSLENVN